MGGATDAQKALLQKQAEDRLVSSYLSPQQGHLEQVARSLVTAPLVRTAREAKERAPRLTNFNRLRMRYLGLTPARPDEIGNFVRQRPSTPVTAEIIPPTPRPSATAHRLSTPGSSLSFLTPTTSKTTPSTPRAPKKAKTGKSEHLIHGKWFPLSPDKSPVSKHTRSVKKKSKKGFPSEY